VGGGKRLQLSRPLLVGVIHGSRFGCLGTAGTPPRARYSFDNAVNTAARAATLPYRRINQHQVSLAVRDNGPWGPTGGACQDLRSASTAWTRPASRQMGGAGLGLSIAQWITTNTAALLREKFPWPRREFSVELPSPRLARRCSNLRQGFESRSSLPILTILTRSSKAQRRQLTSSSRRSS